MYYESVGGHCDNNSASITNYMNFTKSYEQNSHIHKLNPIKYPYIKQVYKLEINK